MVSALILTSGTPPGGCLIKMNRSNGHPWKYAFVMSPDLTVRRSHETHERRMFNPSMSQVGESVRTPVVCRFRPTGVESVCVLEPTIVPVRVPILNTQR